MLKLDRKVGQKIYLYPIEGTEHMTVEEFFAGGQICIQLSQIKGIQASIGIDATNNLVVLREEIA
jgi:sRNA-binding carbon storage regulator CsrA